MEFSDENSDHMQSGNNELIYYNYVQAFLFLKPPKKKKIIIIYLPGENILVWGLPRGDGALSSHSDGVEEGGVVVVGFETVSLYCLLTA